MRARFERLIGGAAFLGTGAAYLTLLIQALTAHWQSSWVWLPERILLAVIGSGLGLLFEPLELFVVRRGYLLLPVLAVVLAWRRTRRFATAVFGVVFAIECARLAALACFSIYVMDHSWGLLSVPLALPPAALLARWRRVPIVSVLVLTGGLCIGVLISVIFQHDYPNVVSPLDRFVPIALVSTMLAGLIATRTTAAPAGGVGRFVRMWGLMAFCVSCLMVILVVTDWLRPRSASPHSFLARSSYEVYVTSDREPPELVWTDTEQIHVLTDPYGESHDTYVLAAGDHRTPQRIWASPTDGFYVQMLLYVGWWKTPPRGQPFSQDPAVTYRHDLLQDGSPCGFAEDPVTNRIFMLSQWRSQYFVMSRDTGATLTTGRFSPAFLGAWHTTPVLSSRIAYVSSGLEDGGLYELNLDSMAATRKASLLDVYETALDPEAHVLWGARPITGEIVGVDSETFAVRSRFRTGFGARDLQRDPRSGHLYTCSLSGHVFRVDAKSGTVATVAWCGRLCRNMFLDTQRDTLWAATDDGICRMPLAMLNGT